MAGIPLEMPLPNLEHIDVKRVRATGIAIVTPVEIGIVGGPLILLEHARMAIRGKNSIVRRLIAKRGKQAYGSVKEFWATDDYELSVTGELRDETLEGEVYPMSKVSELNNIFQHRREVRIESDVAYSLGFSRIAIEDFEVGESKGGWVPYRFRAYSDYDFDLFI